MKVAEILSKGLFVCAILEKDGEYEIYEVHKGYLEQEGYNEINVESLTQFVNDPDNATVGYDYGCFDSLEEAKEQWEECYK